MFAKIEITGILEIVTGMHIGGSSAFSAIGAVDSPVIRDMRTKYPMIPGSSLKGKMRALLAKKYNVAVAEAPDYDAPCLTNLFGCAKKNHAQVSRVLFADMVLLNSDELENHGLTSAIEIKFENSIKRTTAVANPRQIERVVRGAKFPLDIIYEAKDEDMIIQDFKILKDGFRLLQYDYLGGSGSRGYGKVKFCGLQADVVVGDVPDRIMEECRKQLEEI